MDKKIILAVAGAGKTYHICHNLDFSKRNLILAYTRRNISNIEKELNSCKEKSVFNKVFTFHKFLYNFFIRPFEVSIGELFNEKIKSKGLILDEAVKPFDRNGKYNKKYKNKNTLNHYLINDRYYSSNLAELILYLKENSDIFNKAMNNINEFFDYIYIDEFQDFREENYKVLESIINGCKNIVLVGDYYQHSVNAINNSGIPFQKKKKNRNTSQMEKYDISYDEYINLLETSNLLVDNKTLLKSRRCSEDVCNFVSEKLEIKIESEKIKQGEVIFIADEEEAKKILNDTSIMKLVYQQPYIWRFNSMSWSYSKGDTYTNSLVVLTDKFENLDTDKFLIKNIPQSTVNKVYVAMTRTDNNLYLLKNSIFKKIKEEYKKTH